MYVHWNYYLALDDDMSKITRFVEPAHDNFTTYSLELAHLFLASCSEVDVVMKLLCERLGKIPKPKNMDGYRKVVVDVCPKLVNESCGAPRYGIFIEPWAEFGQGQSPLWWRQHQQVKHRRNDHFADANLGNAFNALAALQIATVYYYHAYFNSGQLDCPIWKTTAKLGPEPYLLKLPRNYYYQTLAAPPS